ncbi:GDP-mannose 4,6-dehydratase [Campylobacterota bacterium DY0563]
MDRLLIIGIDSFTGKHLETYLKNFSYDIYGTTLSDLNNNNIYFCNIKDKENIKEVLFKVNPDYIIHLAGISYAAHNNLEDFYSINTIGTLNILEAVIDLNIKLKKIIIASSATVYGNQGLEILDESLCPQPSNHYGASKYSMETLAKNYFDKIPIIIARPFNYTGIGQEEHFLIPKIVKHFKEKNNTIELGNLDVVREFNDISFVCEVYDKLLKIQQSSEVVNICSNRGVKLLDIIKIMQEITNHNIEVKINSKFVRKDDIKTLTGSNKKLFSLIGTVEQIEMKNTLEKMLNR